MGGGIRVGRGWRIFVLSWLALAAAEPAHAQQPDVIANPFHPTQAVTFPAAPQATHAHRPKPRHAALAEPSGSIQAVAGRYAVLRGTRDTGCMITLFSEARSRGLYRAVLAPACRDTGIVIFDPVGWKLGPDGLVMQAREGHSITLASTGPGLWSREASTPPLVLRKI